MFFSRTEPQGQSVILALYAYSMDLTIEAVKKDLLDIYGLLYPMLDNAEKRTSEARKASQIVDKYDAEMRVRRGEAIGLGRDGSMR